jgi:Transcriptional regulator
MSAKQSKRQIKSEENKRKIYESAINLFQKFGYENVSVNDIVHDSGTSVGSFYYYYSSKEELVLIYIKSEETMYTDFYNSTLCGTEFDGRSEIDKLIAFVLYSIEVTHYGGQEFSRIALCSFLRDDKYVRMALNPERSFARIILSLIKEGQSKGTIRQDKSAEQLFRIVNLLVDGMDLDWCMNRGDYDPMSRDKDILTFLLKQIFCP